MKLGRFEAADFQASKDGCDVRIGAYLFTGHLHEYTITGLAEGVSAEIRLEGMTQAWRPGDRAHSLRPARGRLPRLAGLGAHGQLDSHLPDRNRGPRVHRHRVPLPQLVEPALPPHGTPDRPRGTGAEDMSVRTRSSRPTSRPRRSTAWRPFPCTCSPATAR
jgi:hypothetical protein